MKTCGKCHNDLPLSEYYKNKSQSDGLQRFCKACQKKQVRHNKYEKKDTFRYWLKTIREKRHLDPIYTQRTKGVGVY